MVAPGTTGTAAQYQVLKRFGMRTRSGTQSARLQATVALAIGANLLAGRERAGRPTELRRSSSALARSPSSPSGWSLKVMRIVRVRLTRSRPHGFTFCASRECAPCHACAGRSDARKQGTGRRSKPTRRLRRTRKPWSSSRPTPRRATTRCSRASRSKRCPRSRTSSSTYTR